MIANGMNRAEIQGTLIITLYNTLVGKQMNLGGTFTFNTFDIVFLLVRIFP